MILLFHLYFFSFPRFFTPFLLFISKPLLFRSLFAIEHTHPSSFPNQLQVEIPRNNVPTQTLCVLHSDEAPCSSTDHHSLFVSTLTLTREKRLCIFENCFFCQVKILLWSMFLLKNLK